MFKLPKTKLEAIDRYAQMRKARLDLERQAREYKVDEAMLEEWIVEHASINAPWNGSYGRAIVDEKLKYSMVEVNKVLDFAHKNKEAGGYSLVICRLNEKTVREFVSLRKKVPGITESIVKVLSYQGF